MRSLLALLAAIVLTSTTAVGQPDAENPLGVLGISYGASADEVVRACERAGLTVERIDTGVGSSSGYFNIAATGAVYLGQSATLRFGGGSAGPWDKRADGLCSVWAIIEADSSSALRSTLRRCVESLVWMHGPSRYHRVPLEKAAVAGYAEEHYWRVESRAGGDDLDVRVHASLEAPVNDRYLVAVQYTQVYW